jgi:Na+/proline symporter
MTRSDHEEAERLGRRRARQWPPLAAILLAQQATFFSLDEPDRAMRTVDWVRAGGWLALSLVLLAALWTGGYWFKPRAVRALMDDEVTRANRASARALGYLLAMLVAIGLYLTSLFEPVEMRLAMHTVVSAGIATALLRFGLLERRAYRG